MDVQGFQAMRYIIQRLCGYSCGYHITAQKLACPMLFSVALGQRVLLHMTATLSVCVCGKLIVS